MPKQYFCSNCHTRLEVTRKAIKDLGRIVELVTPHECTETPVPWDLDPLVVPKFDPTYRDKIDQNMSDLRDRRDEQTSSAPTNLINQIKRGMQSSPPDQRVEKPQEE